MKKTDIFTFFVDVYGQFIDKLCHPHGKTLGPKNTQLKVAGFSFSWEHVPRCFFSKLSCSGSLTLEKTRFFLFKKSHHFIGTSWAPTSQSGVITIYNHYYVGR